MSKHIVREEVWADADGKAVPYGDPKGKSVLFGVGVEITEEEARSHGLTKAHETKAAQEPKPKPAKGSDVTS